MPDSNLGNTDLESRAAYLSGLVQGLGLESGRPESRVLEQVVGLLSAVVKELAELKEEAAGSSRSREEAVSPRSTEEAGLARPGTASDEERATFLACECPYCGEDIFVHAPPSNGEAGRVGDLREIVLTCTNCGERIHVTIDIDTSELPLDPTLPRREAAWRPEHGPRPGPRRRPPGRGRAH